MKFEQLLAIVENEPVFETGFLLSGDEDAFIVRKQLSRWTAAGKLIQLKRGLYCLAPPYQKSTPHPFLIANRLVPASYISLHSALAYYGMIPEAVPLVTSVTSRYTTIHQTDVGRFDYHHIQASWFTGYRQSDLGNGQKVFIAIPEKALLDLVHLQDKGDDEKYLRSLRLQKLEQLDQDKMDRLATAAGKPKLIRATDMIRRIAEEEQAEYEEL